MNVGDSPVIYLFMLPYFLYVCIPVYVHSPKENTTYLMLLRQGLSPSLVPGIPLSLHTSPTLIQSTAVIDVHQQVPVTLLPLHRTPHPTHPHKELLVHTQPHPAFCVGAGIQTWVLIPI